MSLPYPSMVFVPLDILTAEEMNQLVANIESLSAGTGLANGAITTDKVADNAVTGAKINPASVKTRLEGSFPCKVIRGVDAGQPVSVYKVKVTAEAYSVFIGFIYSRYMSQPIGFRIQVGGTANQISSFTIENADFTVTIDGDTATVTYLSGTYWANFYMEFFKFIANMDLTITRP